MRTLLFALLIIAAVNANAQAKKYDTVRVTITTVKGDSVKTYIGYALKPTFTDCCIPDPVILLDRLFKRLPTDEEVTNYKRRQ